MVIASMIAAYLAGCWLSYYSIRKVIRQKKGKDWLLIERFIAVMLSLLSWFMMLCFLYFVFSVMVFNVNPDKEVKW